MRCFATADGVLRLQMASALDFGLVPLLRKALEIFRGQLPGVANERVSRHRAIKAPRAAVGKSSDRSGSVSISIRAQKSGTSSSDSPLSGKSIGSGILYDLHSRRAHFKAWE